jgi:uncharacterized protein
MTTTGSNLRIVHSSVGRLRVHCPHADTARLRLLPGVRSAEMNSWTQNILILFYPQQTSERTLLAALGESVPAEVSVPSSPEIHSTEPVPDVPTGYVTGIRGRLYRIFGWTSLGMAVVGAVTPGIPTVPFVLLGSYFFIRSSPKTHAWLLNSKYFGGILRDWEEKRGVSQSVKLTALALIGIGVVFTVLTNLPMELVAAILAMEVIGMIIVLRLRVVETATPALQ